MGAPETKCFALSGFWRCHPLILFLSVVVPSSALAETVPSLPPPPTMPTVGGWYTNPSVLYPPFPGGTSGQAVCDYWKNDPGNYGAYSNIIISFLPAASGFGGVCTRVNPWGPGVIFIGPQPMYIELCPPGYTSPAAGGIYPQTCVNFSADYRCPTVATGETPFKLDLPSKLTCSRPDVCPPPDAIDPTSGQCVHCPIRDLPPITDPEVQAFEDNSDLSDTARLTNEMQAALQRLLTAATAAGGNPTVGSAYRPPAYNQHLIEVWNKREEFLDAVDRPEVTSNASCMLVLWPKIQRHFQKHGLLDAQPPVPNSRHTRGLAVDVTINLPSANIDALAVGAGLRRPLPASDPVHFQFP